MITLPSRDTNAGILTLFSWGLTPFLALLAGLTKNTVLIWTATVVAVPLLLWLTATAGKGIATELKRFNQWAPRA